MDNIDLQNISTTNRTIGLTNYRYGTCNCLISPSCIQPAVIEEIYTPTFSFDGFFIGCYVLESVLRSSMKCLYSQICINRTILKVIIKHPDSIIPFPYTLNINENSSYNINTTFSQLLDRLMVEKWNEIVSHQSYYDSCKPLSCNYTFIGRRQLTHIITLLFGIIGGLNKVLRFIVPCLVSIIIKILNRNKVLPTNNHSSLT